MTSTSDRACAGCRFFVGGRRYATGWWPGPGFKYGDCRIRSVPGEFPSRYLDDWCGEWQEREEPRMDDK
jgi:hypothetical protein